MILAALLVALWIVAVSGYALWLHFHADKLEQADRDFEQFWDRGEWER